MEIPMPTESAMHLTLDRRPILQNGHRDRHLALIAALAALVCAIVLLCSSAAAQAAETSAGTFLQSAAQIDIAEVGAGKLAQQKSENADVQAFGKMLETDHSKHLTAVEDLAKSTGVSIPSEPADADKKEAEKLQSLSGRAFDQEFVKHMVEGHKLAITAYQEEAKTGSSDTAGLAQKTLPTLQHHLETAESLQKTLGQQSAE
jgi:putative membrane protein